MPPYYPVFLDVRDRRCVIIGGNRVAEEKAARLFEFGASAVVISPELTDGLASMLDDGLAWIRRGYEPGDLEGAFIAIVADTSDDDVNKAVSVEAKQRNVPLNVADVTDLCTWIAPSIVRRGDVVVAASTGGSSPALARRFREQLNRTNRVETGYDLMALADLAPLLSAARQELARQGVRLNPDHWQACLTDDLIDLVRAGRAREASECLIANLMAGAACGCPEGVCRMWEELGEPEASAQAP